MKKLGVWTLSAITPLLILAGCGKKQQAIEGANTVKIAFTSSLTGPAGVLGVGGQTGFTLAAEELNAKGVMIGGKKYKIDVIVEDDAGEPKQATAIAQKLVDEGVSGVVGSFPSGCSISAAPIYAKAGIPQITPATSNPKFNQMGFKTAFMLGPNDLRAGQAIADYAAKNMGIKTAAVIDDRTAYGQGMADEFKKTFESLGGKVVDREFTTATSVDFSSILTTIKEHKPDLIFLGGYYSLAGPILNQMKALGLKAKFMAGSAVCVPELLQIAGKSIGNDSVYCGEPKGVDKASQEAAAKFKAAYERKYNSAPPIYAANSYDAIEVMVAAMEKAGSIDPKVYLPVLAVTKDYRGASGSVSFDEHGSLMNAATTIVSVKDGKYVDLDMVTN